MFESVGWSWEGISLQESLQAGTEGLGTCMLSPVMGRNKVHCSMTSLFPFLLRLSTLTLLRPQAYATNKLECNLNLCTEQRIHWAPQRAQAGHENAF